MNSQKKLTDLISIDEKCEFHGSAALPLPAGFKPGSLYVRTHIRLETPSYRQISNHSPRFPDDDSRDTFYEQLEAILTDANMIVDGTYARTFGEVPEQLHMHPDDLNGFVSFDRMGRIVEAIMSGHSSASTLRWIDVYAICEQLDDDEKLMRLNHYREALAERLLTMAYTGKRKVYRDVTSDGLFYEYGAIYKGFPGLQFVEHFSRGMGGCPVSAKFEQSLINDLINQGLLHERSRDDRLWHRSSMKTELGKIRKGDRGEFWSVAMRVAENER